MDDDKWRDAWHKFLLNRLSSLEAWHRFLLGSMFTVASFSLAFAVYLYNLYGLTLLWAFFTVINMAVMTSMSLTIQSLIREVHFRQALIQKHIKKVFWKEDLTHEEIKHDWEKVTSHFKKRNKIDKWRSKK